MEITSLAQIFWNTSIYMHFLAFYSLKMKCCHSHYRPHHSCTSWLVKSHGLISFEAQLLALLDIPTGLLIKAHLTVFPPSWRFCKFEPHYHTFFKLTLHIKLSSHRRHYMSHFPCFLLYLWCSTVSVIPAGNKGIFWRRWPLNEVPYIISMTPTRHFLGWNHVTLTIKCDIWFPYTVVHTGEKQKASWLLMLTNNLK